jgi:excisionase family DNA binding protein
MAALLRIPKATMYKLAQLGRVPAFKVGKHWRFLRRDVEEWLAAHSAKAISVEVGER